jgi:hypothetical protein
MHEAMRNSYKTLVGRPQRKRSFGRHRHRWENNIKMDVKEIVCEVMNWIQEAQDKVQQQAFLNAVMKLLAPYQHKLT